MNTIDSSNATNILGSGCLTGVAPVGSGLHLKLSTEPENCDNVCGWHIEYFHPT